jgi:hypothetical protein
MHASNEFPHRSGHLHGVLHGVNGGIQATGADRKSTVPDNTAPGPVPGLQPKVVGIGAHAPSAETTASADDVSYFDDHRTKSSNPLGALNELQPADANPTGKNLWRRN